MDKSIDYDSLVKLILNTRFVGLQAEPDDGVRFGIVLGGQPGVGKSYLAKFIAEEFGWKYAYINGDDYRPYHPDFDEFQKDPATSPLKTQKFASTVVGRLIDHFVREKVNIVIEGTFRTAEVPIETLKFLSNNGYRTFALVLTCDRNLSWKSCECRYFSVLEEDRMHGRPTSARRTPKEHHDLVAASLATNVATVYGAGVAKRMIVFVRLPDGRGDYVQKALFDSEKQGAIAPERLREAVQCVLDGNFEAARSVVGNALQAGPAMSRLSEEY